MQPFARVFAVAILGASIADAADQNSSESSEQSEEITVSEHPPRLVYFRYATPSPSRIARQALRTYCRERASQLATSTANLDEGPAIAHFCRGARPTILMGVDYRDEFNKTLYACRADMDLHYNAYPVYWGDVFDDSRWCARIEYDYEGRHYRVTD